MAAVPDIQVRARVTIESANLSPAQVARGEALMLARDVLRSGGPLTTARADVFDLHSLAVFILDGGDPWRRDPDD